MVKFKNAEPQQKFTGSYEKRTFTNDPNDSLILPSVWHMFVCSTCIVLKMVEKVSKSVAKVFKRVAKVSKRWRRYIKGRESN